MQEAHLVKRLLAIGVPTSRSSIHKADVEYYSLRQVIACRYCSSGCGVCDQARALVAEFKSKNLPAQVQDDTVVITITSRLAKTGKSTIARIIAEALGKVGLSCGVEDDIAPSPGQTPNELWMAHCERVAALVARQQSVIVKVKIRP